MRRPFSARVAQRLFVVVIGLTAVLPSATQAGQASDRREVSYRDVSVRVPSDWPVYDLDAQPALCARFDVSAAYVGRQGPHALCPSQIFGAAEAVHIEPWGPEDPDMQRLVEMDPIGGEPARTDPRARQSGRIVTAFPRLRTIVTVTFGADQALAEEILGTLRVSRPAGPAASASGTPAPETPAPPRSPRAAPAAPIPPARVASHPAPLQPGIFAGEGFDTCANPALEKMQAWLASPYRAVGIYIGGINHGCKAQTLTAGWVADAARMGWSFFPIYVGLQAPCQASTRTVKIDPANAAGQGRAAADDAIARADLFGLPTGSPLYYDIEAYSGSASCDQAVRSFLDAWSGRVRERRYVSGVYSSEASGIDNLAADYSNPGFRRPDVIWTAHWGESKRIFGHNQTWLPDSTWPNHQRIHQYTGGHVETWGGQSINIDSDLLDAPVVRFAAAPRWTAGDIDGADGDDLVHLCCGDYLNTWLTKSDGQYDVRSFRPVPGYGIQLGSWIPADISGDGRADLIHVCCRNWLNTWISRGDGTYSVSSFTPAAAYGIQGGTWVPSDVNGDGRTDLIHVCCRDYAHVWISRGDGTYEVGAFRIPGYGMQLGSWRSADINGDGNGDLVHICCPNWLNTWISRGDGTYNVSSFTPAAGYGIQGGTWISSDVNGDTRSDLVHVCCSNYAHTWLSRGDGTYDVGAFSPAPGYGMQGGSWLPVDVNGDAKGDLVHLCCPNWLNTWISAGDGTYSVGPFSPSPGYGIQGSQWIAGDADADGNGDLVHLCCPTYLHTWFSETDGTYRITSSPL
jgi:hypothetical protein